ncbi:MAG: NAD-glutamate dehydrogenase, partial [Acidobacteria bacterium]|nr:NAD-glutamate dehydrogenase [Acidobacteriota bacterium]
GVDCSDHEVNIKILLDGIVSGGDLTGKQRDLLLQEMTDEVAQLVLRDNYLQNLAISVEEAQGTALVDFQQRMMRELERAGKLDRALEYLPDDETLAERVAEERGLTRPEIAVLLAYSKMTLYQELLESSLPDDPLLVEDLVRYFPHPLRERYRQAIAGHRLRREIIATSTTNSMINRVGPTFVTRLVEMTGRAPRDIARAYIVARDVFHLRELWARIEELDDRLPATSQMEMILDVGRLIERTTLWFLRHTEAALDEISKTVQRYEPGVVTLADELPAILPREHRRSFEERAKVLQRAGVPAELARRIASLPFLVSACDIVRIADDREVREVARVYFLIGARLGLGWLRDAARRMTAKNHWQKDALGAIVDDLYAHQSILATRVLEAGGDQAKPVERWMDSHRHGVQRLRGLLEELRAAPTIEVSMLAVADHQLRSLTLS